ncbi:hypothetical protein GCM10009696_18610 [Kocuria himachalensis]
MSSRTTARDSGEAAAVSVSRVARLVMGALRIPGARAPARGTGRGELCHTSVPVGYCNVKTRVLPERRVSRLPPPDKLAGRSTIRPSAKDHP